MSNPKTCADTASATSLPALAGGPSRCDSPDGPLTDLFGQALAPASRSAPPAASVAATMSATYGLRSSASSASVALQQSLANRLAERLDSRGSTMFALTWKAKATPQRRQICQLAASARPTDGSDCSGWPTPVAQPANGTPENFLRRKRESVARGNKLGVALTDLQMVAQLAAWPTPTAQDHFSANATANRSNPNSQHHAGTTLTDAARFSAAASPWATPSARDWKDSPGMATTGTNPDGSTRDRTDQLPRQAHMTAWATPQASDAKNRYSNEAIALRRQDSGKQASIEQQAHLTPGPTSNGSPAATAKPAQLNPAFSRWLQGYPRAWCEAAIEAWHRTPTRARKRV